MNTHKGIMIILDGLGDRPVERLGNRTPLEVAQTPNFDRLAERGITGFVSPVAPWIPVSTMVGAGLLMGLARKDLTHLSRGPVHAMSIGLRLNDTDIAIRCNFATLAKNKTGFAIIDRRAGRIDEHTHELAQAIEEIDLYPDVSITFRACTAHRAVLVLSGPNLSPNISDTDPGAARKSLGLLPCESLRPDDPKAHLTASLVNDFLHKSHEVLQNHPVNLVRRKKGLLPANGFVTRGAGIRYDQVRNLIQDLGISTAVITGESTIEGLCHLFNFDLVYDKRFTAFSDTDLVAKFEAAKKALDDHDLVFVHIKGTDVISHDLEPEKKISFLERIDKAIEPLMYQSHVVGITGDHSTDSNVGRHCGDPVPSLLSASHIRKDNARFFSEKECIQGGLGHLNATSFLCGLLDNMNLMQNYRLHHHHYYFE